jgi:formylglycine-generating enzyme required for sulfatase activity
MGENPSRFQSSRRPVEQVSWEDCRGFLETLNARQPSLKLRLPTEAQWEHACRAGTTRATWSGDLEILGDNNAPLLDDFAWYGGNSGVDFDLKEGESSSNWPEKQTLHRLAGTREVKLKKPNPWGLYDMLGNVWEWCSDYWAERYPDGPRTDPEGPEEGAKRVIRGGSWGDLARSVRAASRYWYPPGDRDVDLGFRLSRGP